VGKIVEVLFCRLCKNKDVNNDLIVNYGKRTGNHQFWKKHRFVLFLNLGEITRTSG